jgi:hypothetical protein
MLNELLYILRCLLHNVAIAKREQVDEIKKCCSEKASMATAPLRNKHLKM